MLNFIRRRDARLEDSRVRGIQIEKHQITDRAHLVEYLFGKVFRYGISHREAELVFARAGEDLLEVFHGKFEHRMAFVDVEVIGRALGFRD